MWHFCRKNLSTVLLSLICFKIFASDTIDITVTTKEKNAIAIGYTVNGNQYGGLGNSYSGKGPKNKEYQFGYKKDSIFGENISCGSITLNQDSKVTLVNNNNQCIGILG
ncbi:TPA: hypothetical protein JBK40_15560 [Legionella pneumophila]|uniref:hypothetical protein n=1 Tax=Legionella pneumophila TaxID=446 RepID=UPI00048EA22A|nr:hypothetical protein [Legionella pneumophila]RYB34128.1 hypothetical protein D7242_13015 [Legionella pneumophila]RYW23265.1 hypothetical protein D7234_14295 [Legionella pneumophila]HAT1868888.1 hypothetical protein [Legionella pneumophila]HAT1908957.1 hypothetical protein [Legionella pneumophila]HAT1918244.1 hypothetical protein [Legionella pneumophila]